MEELDMRIELEILITRRIAMLTENSIREIQGHSPAYDEEGFQEWINEVKALSETK